MVTLTAIFPTLETPEIDWENIARVGELENALNARAKRGQRERVAKALERGDYEGAHQALINKPHKYILNPWKFK